MIFVAAFGLAALAGLGITVHARGSIRWIDDAAWLAVHVTALSDAHEAERPTPWKISEAPESYIASMLRGIVGFELTIATLDGTPIVDIKIALS